MNGGCGRVVDGSLPRSTSSCATSPMVKDGEIHPPRMTVRLGCV